MITRFAPSPTGKLHLGHAFSALLAFEEAQRTNGTFLLRIEDIDHNRCHPDHETAIYRDLTWLGIHWQGKPVRQSTRGQAYRDAIRQLSARDLLYPCFCSRKKIVEELANLASAPHQAHPVYPGTCRNLRPKERQQRILSGEPHGLRLDTRAALAVIPEAARSWREVDDSTFLIEDFLNGDEIIMRKDIGTSYHLAVVVDDAWQSIDRIIRGEDLRASTAIHRMLQGLLGYPLPDYHHHRLILDKDGQRLAKRDAASSLAHYRESGMTPAQVRAMLGFREPEPAP